MTIYKTMYSHVLSSVRDFNFLFGSIYKTEDTSPLLYKMDSTHEKYDQKQIMLRYNLIKEEITEYKQGLLKNSCLEQIDALGDILYVVAGAKVYFNFVETIQIENKLKDIVDGFVFCKIDDEYVSSIESDLWMTTNNIYIDMAISTLDELLEELNKITAYIINGIPEKDIYMTSNYYNIALDKLVIEIFKLSTIYNVDIIKVFDYVHASNMSKICVTEEDAIETVNRYKQLYVDNVTNNPFALNVYETPEYKMIIHNNTNYWIIYDEKTKKILKSHKYNEVNFLI